MAIVSGVYMAATACVIGIATGQVVFKAAAIAINDSGSYFAPKSLALLMLAMAMYATTSLAWVYVLQKIDLGKVYPLMALAFILVPIASKLVFNESFSSQYFIGIFFIMIGIFFCVKV